MEEKNYEAIIEAILFTMGESVELDKIANAIELDKQETKKKIEALRQKYEQEERGIQIIELDGAYQMCTKNEMYEYLIRIAKQPKKRVLFGTTEEFLRSFGVHSIDELPVLNEDQVEEFKHQAEQEAEMKLEV